MSSSVFYKVSAVVSNDRVVGWGGALCIHIRHGHGVCAPSSIFPQIPSHILFHEGRRGEGAKTKHRNDKGGSGAEGEEKIKCVNYIVFACYIRYYFSAAEHELLHQMSNVSFIG